ncbi:putative lipid-binding protein AIR1 [Panicum virgatum]|uniref:Bifunctional inhibitor/plant lipid transfer protein/seed storage helical domain-containing protein n=1 Tax=Panicum virgatum TaxID=38727 RepID=A0A8T0XMZ1_PANVG|nr:putative lipid-binding protein AIR1 [Panicum virgatum]KAG2660358.1 hypothetical protein PVAP13_1KG423600 [Panicum virgatum]
MAFPSSNNHLSYSDRELACWLVIEELDILFLAVNLVVLGVATPEAFGHECPRDALKLGVCADVLGLIKANVGRPPALPCCSLLEGLVDLEAAACLCAAVKANVLNILPLNLPIELSLILNYCGKSLPAGFLC